MNQPREHGPAATWDALERLTLADEAERVAALTDAELDGEHLRQGLDAKALRTRGWTVAASLGAEPPGKRRPLYQRRLVSLAGAALAMFAAAASVPLVAIPFVRRGGLHPAGSAPQAQREAELATALRGEALHACAQKRWLECWHKLDAAKALDAAGDDTDEIREARVAIRAALDPREP